MFNKVTVQTKKRREAWWREKKDKKILSCGKVSFTRRIELKNTFPYIPPPLGLKFMSNYITEASCGFHKQGNDTFLSDFFHPLLSYLLYEINFNQHKKENEERISLAFFFIVGTFHNYYNHCEECLNLWRYSYNQATTVIR